MMLLVKRFLEISFVVGIISVAVSACDSAKGEHAAASTKPNIIYIYADDLGYGELGAYGQEKIKTPHLDRMAREGMRFTQHYSSAPVCAPARCMLLTGQHAGHSYIRSNYEMGGFADEHEGGQMPLPACTYTLAKMLQEAGYTTGAIGKWGLGVESTTGDPNEQGFDYFYGYLDQKQAHNYYPTHLWENGQWDTLNNAYFNPHQQLEKAPDDPEVFERFIGEEYAPARMTEKAKNFIKENKEEPFFLYLPYTIPHVSLQVPENEAYQMYENQWDTVPYLGQDNYTPHPQPLAAYAGMITTLDSYVGEIMQLVKELGLDENTIMMFSSDNGTTSNGGTNAAFFNSTAGLRGLKGTLYEGGIREPFIARWPGKIASGKISNHVSVQYDMFATLADLIGVAPPQNDGISLLPTLLGNDEAQKKHEFIYFEYQGKGGQQAIRMGDWKGIRVDIIDNVDAPWELYNLTQDPSETTNVAADYPEIITQLDSVFQQEHRPAHIREWNFLSPRFTVERM